MSFSYTVNSEANVGGGAKIVSGTYTNSTSTGGDIYTGLSTVLAFFLQPKGSSIVSDQPAVNETLPKATDGITIVTANNEVGTWLAIGLG